MPAIFVVKVSLRKELSLHALPNLSLVFEISPYCCTQRFLQESPPQTSYSIHSVSLYVCKWQLNSLLFSISHILNLMDNSAVTMPNIPKYRNIGGHLKNNPPNNKNNK